MQSFDCMGVNTLNSCIVQRSTVYPAFSVVLFYALDCFTVSSISESSAFLVNFFSIRVGKLFLYTARSLPQPLNSAVGSIKVTISNM